MPANDVDVAVGQSGNTAYIDDIVVAVDQPDLLALGRIDVNQTSTSRCHANHAVESPVYLECLLGCKRRPAGRGSEACGADIAIFVSRVAGTG